MKLLFALACVFCFATSRADEAGVTDGNSLMRGLDLCRRSQSGGTLTDAEMHQAVFTMAWLRGFSDACGVWNVVGTNNIFRLPKEGVSQNQMIMIVEKYLKDHPDKLHLMAEMTCFQALQLSFPNPDPATPPPK